MQNWIMILLFLAVGYVIGKKFPQLTSSIGF